MTFAPSLLWTPILSLSSVRDNSESFDNGNTKLRVSYNGGVSWLKNDVIKTTCVPNVRRFPFDTQTCRFSFVLVGYNAEEIKINVPEEEARNKFEACQRNMGKLKRKPTFFVVTLLIPAFILLFVNPFVFLLPVESGKRLSFAMPTFLSFTVFISITYGVMPRRSEPMSSLLVVFTLSFIESALIIFGTHSSYPIHSLYSCFCRAAIIKLFGVDIDPEKDEDKYQQPQLLNGTDETLKNNKCETNSENAKAYIKQLGWKNISKVFIFAYSVTYD
ncbi:hypothetical protein KUTeg_004502 [Tegillarca granosa]|uniref:Neurotransmitter-gated ion-channel ligand-binding domain-containing protein n=1 Tax=Tegillarca granosa TaxID=220873 RepID=A0ABQ9FRP3_TEGGR|nr:hypothetical protein KUTeg_004502 [Tegillarca granosa]